METHSKAEIITVWNLASYSKVSKWSIQPN